MADSFIDAVRTRFRALLSMARFGQFVSVGSVGAVVDIVSLWLLVEFTVLGPVVGKAIAWELGIIVIFIINEHWTFSGYGDGGRRALGRRFFRSNVVRFAGFLVTLSVLAGLYYGFSVWYLAANVVGIVIGFFVNYTCESLYTWQVHRD